MLCINQPHFAHSYRLFYRTFRQKALGTRLPSSLRGRYLIAGLVVPCVLLGFFAAALFARNPRILGYSTNFMFFLAGWHYVKQGYGILVVDSVRKRLPFSGPARALLRANGYACC